MRRLAMVFLAGVAALSASCTEKFTTTGSCPTLCPGGQATFRDTVLTPVPNGDSSFTGFLASSNLASVLVSNGGQYGEHRAVMRFQAHDDSVLIGTTNHTFTVDSVTIELGIQDRDTTAPNFVLEIYRLPRTLDTTADFATVEGLMTPATLIAEAPQLVSFRSGIFHVTLAAADLSRLGFTPGDSTILTIGLRARADGVTAARIGTPPSGTFAPHFTMFVKANDVADSLASTLISRTADTYFTVAPPSAPPASSLLAVGGIPVSRAFVRFVLPAYLRDSATIIRATLQLQADAPLIGIPADTALLVTGALLTDFGAKSPIIPGIIATSVLLPGDSVVSVEVTSLVQLWQGTNSTPSVLRLSLAQEGATFIFPLFRSTRSASGSPTLRITYRPPFAFEGY
jgi:hypothetical protein